MSLEEVFHLNITYWHKHKGSMIMMFYFIQKNKLLLWAFLIFFVCVA